MTMELNPTTASGALTDEEERRLRAVLSPSAEELALLHARLATASTASGMLDVAYTEIDSPVGPLLLAATEAGLLRVAYRREDPDAVLASIAASVSPRVLRAPNRLSTASRQLDEYFAGRRRRFELPLDHTLSHGFRLTVQEQLPEIPYGSTASYSEVAGRVGRPKAVRAVGTACARNPLPIVVPCHRVLRSDGGLGGYIGGPDAKRMLLELEEAA